MIPNLLRPSALTRKGTGELLMKLLLWEPLCNFTTINGATEFSIEILSDIVAHV